jgi:hypothetical protein
VGRRPGGRRGDGCVEFSFVRAPTPAYRQLRREFQRGDFTAVHAGGDAVAVELSGDPDQRELVPAAVLMHGAALAELGDLANACRYLGQGLDMVGGTRSERELGGADWYALRLLELLTRRGRYRDVLARAAPLEAPDRRPETRLGAIRARVAVLTATGDLDAAWQFVNAATSLVTRVRSNLQVAMVDGDRALLLAASGRVDEAVILGDQVLARTARPGEGRQLTWAAADAAAVALGLSRATAGIGDLDTAQRLLALGREAAARVDDDFLSAHAGLAEATVWRCQGRLAEAEHVGRDVMLTFTRLGCLPGIAEARLEEARLAWQRGMGLAAVPLLRLALAELADLGHRRQAAEVQRLLEAATPPSDDQPR